MDDPAAVLRTSAPGAGHSAAASSAAAGDATARDPSAGAHSGAVALPAVVAPTVPGTGGCGRQLFSVDLRTGETTIVSWKKLLKEGGLGPALPPPLPAVAAVQPVVAPLAGPSGAVHPTENDPNDPSQSNRFNAVIEKIERLYMGKHSSDEEDLDDVPDDDQYDTEDSFIDDAELAIRYCKEYMQQKRQPQNLIFVLPILRIIHNFLEFDMDEYFEVDNLATKHTGFFVNKGKLEQSEYGSVQNVVPDGSVQNVEPKKWRRRDSSSSYIENNPELAPGSMLLKAPPKSSSLQIGKNLRNSNLSSYSESLSEGNRPVKSKSNAPGRMLKMNSSDHATGAEHVSHVNLSSKDVSLPSPEVKDFHKHRTAVPQLVVFGQKSPAYWDKDAPVQRDLQWKKTSNGVKQDLPKKMHREEKYGADVYLTQTTLMAADRHIEGSGTKAKGTRLERAIRDLQNIVSEYRPQNLYVHDVDPNFQAAVKRRLPQEVKQKLAKVARLSANQGKIPEDELINRLMDIVGHLVQRRTLKRNMKEMVESGLYAKQEKADKFHQVKIEIYEMIKARLAAKTMVTEQQDASADDFQGSANIDGKGSLKGKIVLDAALEDRICDLYDLYVEGMDEDKGPQSRKLYAELADLWPQGYMDKVKIRDAISRSKERRKLLYRQHKIRNEERMKRRRLAAAAKSQGGNPVSTQYAITQQVMQPPMKSTQPSTTSRHNVYPAVSQASRNAGKVGATSVGALSDGNRSSSTDMKKRKPDSDAVDVRANPHKAPLLHSSEKQKPSKRADEVKVNSLPQMVLAIPSHDS